MSEPGEFLPLHLTLPPVNGVCVRGSQGGMALVVPKGRTPALSSMDLLRGYCPSESWLGWLFQHPCSDLTDATRLGGGICLLGSLAGHLVELGL